jgi:hypothetical protein
VPKAGVDSALLQLIPNAQAAAAKLKSQGLAAWTTVTSGAYKPFLSAAEQSVSQVYGMPKSQVKQLAQSAPQGGNVQTTSIGSDLNPANIPGELLNAILKAFGLGSFPDLIVRGGLVLLGAAMILVGLLVLASGKTATNLAVTVAAPELGARRQRRNIAARGEEDRRTISHQEAERRRTISHRRGDSSE